MDQQPRCSQCNKPAVWQMGAGHLLCVDCHLKVMQSFALHDDMMARLEHQMIDMAEAMAGLPGVMPRPPLRQPIVAGGRTTINNIRVVGSTVGAINTGEVSRLYAHVTGLETAGAVDVARAFKELTQAVLATSELADEKKNEAIEHLSFLAEQARTPTEQRRESLVRASLSVVNDLFGSAAAMATLWTNLAPLIRGVFG